MSMKVSSCYASGKFYNWCPLILNEYCLISSSIMNSNRKNQILLYRIQFIFYYKLYLDLGLSCIPHPDDLTQFRLFVLPLRMIRSNLFIFIIRLIFNFLKLKHNMESIPRIEDLSNLILSFDKHFKQQMEILEQIHNIFHTNNREETKNRTSSLFQTGYNSIQILTNSSNPPTTVDEQGEYFYLNRTNNFSTSEVLSKYQNFNLLFQKFKTELSSYQPKSNFIKQKSDYTNLLLYLLDTKNLTKEKLFLRFLKDLWILLKRIDKIQTDQIAIELFNRLRLNAYEIGTRNYSQENFELHRAVYENNLRTIRKICALETMSHIYCDINEVDSHGHTPLILAIKLNNLDAINVLCDHEADIKLRSFNTSYSALEHALHSRNKKILKILINGQKKQKISHWDNNKNDFIKVIKSIPDFSMDLQLNFDSNVFHLFSSITPCDYYKINKSGGNLRIDMNVNSMNSIKGRSSIVIQEKGNDVTIYKIDHEKKVSYDYIDYLTNNNDEDKKVNQMLNEGVQHNKIYAQNVTLSEGMKKKDEVILDYLCKKYFAKGMLYITKEKIKSKSIVLTDNGSLVNKYKSFSNYFDDGLRINNLSLKKEVTSKKNSDKTVKDSLYKKKKNPDNSESDLEQIEKLKLKKNVKINKKSLDMSVWLSDQFPLKLNDFLPLIHILSFTSNEFSKLKSTICSHLLPFESFPLKISFPLGLTFYALLTMTGFSLNTPTGSLFDINYLSETNSKGNEIVLDEKYAQNFYENYYKEKQTHVNKTNEDEVSSLEDSDYLKVREIFLTNTEDDAEYIKYSNISTQRLVEQTLKTQQEHSNISISQVEMQNSEVNYHSKETAKIAINELNRSIQKKSKICPISIKTNELQNCVSREDLTSSEQDSSFRKLPLYENEVPNELVNPLRLPVSIKKTSHKVRNKHVDSNKHNNDFSQKTLKCDIQPKLIKNFRNFYKYESNVNKELEDLSKEQKPEEITAVIRNKGETKENMCVIH